MTGAHLNPTPRNNRDTVRHLAGLSASPRTPGGQLGEAVNVELSEAGRIAAAGEVAPAVDGVKAPSDVFHAHCWRLGRAR